MAGKGPAENEGKRCGKRKMDEDELRRDGMMINWRVYGEGIDRKGKGQDG